MGRKSAENLISAIDKSRSAPFARVIYGLGIRHVGEHVARVLAGHFSSIDRLASASADELVGIQEIGPIVADSIHGYFREDHNRRFLGKLRDAGVRLTAEEGPQKKRIFEGLTFVFTGGLGTMTRDEVGEMVESMGGRASGSVSTKTDYVVAGKDPGSKLDKAKKLGIEIIDEGRFRRMCNLD
jgi:DNA ligase (NAD+)